MVKKIGISNGCINKITASFVFNLLAVLKKNNKNVLLIDMTVNGTASSLYGVKNTENSFLDVFLLKKDLKDCIFETRYGDIIPSDKRMEYFYDRKDTFTKRVKWLDDFLKAVEEKYDYIYIMLPENNNNFIATAAYMACDYVLMVSNLDNIDASKLKDLLLELEKVDVYRKQYKKEKIELLGIVPIYGSREFFVYFNCLDKIYENNMMELFFKTDIKSREELFQSNINFKTILETGGNEQAIEELEKLCVNISDRIEAVDRERKLPWAEKRA